MEVTWDDELEVAGPSGKTVWSHGVYASAGRRAGLSHAFRKLVPNRMSQGGQTHATSLGGLTGLPCVFLAGKDTRAAPGEMLGKDTRHQGMEAIPTGAEAAAVSEITRGL